MSVVQIVGAQQNLLRAALRCLSSEYSRDDTADSAAEAEYSYEQLALAARELARAVDTLPPDQLPVGWSTR